MTLYGLKTAMYVWWVKFTFVLHQKRTTRRQMLLLLSIERVHETAECTRERARISRL